MKKILMLILAGVLILSSGCTDSTMKSNNLGALAGNKAETSTIPELKLTVSDPDNLKKLPEEKREHSYGIAKNGRPHEISINAQEFFDKKGYNAVCLDTVSKSRVLYLTFDSGYENGCTATILDTLKEKNVPAAFFCTLNHIKDNPELIKRMIDEGHIVGNHSAKHPDFSILSREQMANEIMLCDNYLRKNFNYTSPFFRFPEGAYNECALELVASIGFKSVFWSLSYEDWDVYQIKGADYAFEKVTSRLHPGAIILLHSVSFDNRDALGRIIDYARENGYEFKALTELGRS